MLRRRNDIFEKTGNRNQKNHPFGREPKGVGLGYGVAVTAFPSGGGPPAGGRGAALGRLHKIKRDYLYRSTRRVRFS